MDFPTTIALSCGSCLASTRRGKTNSLRPIPPGTTSSYPRSCALEAGSAATATAIPSSQPRYCDKRWACRASALTVSDQLKDLAERSPDHSPHRRNEPYRLAVSGIYARVAATARAVGQPEASRHAVGEAPPYAEAAEFVADLGILYHSLTSNRSSPLAR